MLVILAIIVAAAGVVLAWYMYVSRPVRPAEISAARTPLGRLLLNAYYVDALYDRLIVRPLFALCDALAWIFDTRVIDGIVNSTGKAVMASGAKLRRLQSGYTVNYALTMLLGAIALVLPVFVYPLSYTVWQAVDLAMHPPEPGDGTPPPVG